MELHEHLAELVDSVGPQVLDDPDGFRAALDDFLDEGAASTGDINLLVDTVRLGAYGWMMNTIASGGEGARAVEAAGTILARDRGSRDLDSARWACAVLGFAVGKVGDADVRRYRTRSLAPLDAPEPADLDANESTPPPTPVVASDASTAPGQPPTPALPPAPAPAPAPRPAVVTVHGDPPTDFSVSAPSRPEPRRSWAPVLAALVVLALVGGGFTAWRVLGDDDGSPGDTTDPTGAVSGPTDPNGSGGPSDVPVEERTDYVPVPEDPEPLPFDIDAELVNQPCTGEVVVMLATASVPANYADKLGQAIEGVPDVAVLRASDSCDAFQETNPDSGAPIYNAYLGPFPTAADACEVIGTLDSQSAWVRELANPSQERELCFCEESVDGLPVLGPESDLDALVTRRLIGQVQWALYLDGQLPKEAVFRTLGQYTAEFAGAVTTFQREALVEENGSVTRETWERLLDEFCDTDYYDVER
jgi:hypothetical protein